MLPRKLIRHERKLQAIEALSLRKYYKGEWVFLTATSEKMLNAFTMRGWELIAYDSKMVRPSHRLRIRREVLEAKLNA